MKILVLGGMHGNELLGVKLVRSLGEQPIAGVDVCMANPRAVERIERYTETDLNRSFGVVTPQSYEERRAVELQELAAQYDLVLDFHNTQTANNDCSFVGEECSPLLYRVASAVGVPRCIEATYDCINKYCLNTLSVEVSVGGTLDSIDVWRGVIAQLAADGVGSVKPVDRLYRFARRITWAEYEQHGFDWQPFMPLSARDREALVVDEPCVPIFIGSQLTEYYGTLLTSRPIST